MLVNVIDASHKIEYISPEPLKRIELAARNCYKSEGRISPGSDERIVNLLLTKGHNSMLEFCDIIVRFIIDRGVSHELVRHRMASYAQESTRYVAYKDCVTVIRPFGLEGTAYETWQQAMVNAAEAYRELLSVSPQWARSVLPNSLKTEVLVKANAREWRHILKQRTDKAAHPQMREVMVPLWHELQTKVPLIFDTL